MILAGACALGAATCFAVCSVMQHRAGRQVETGSVGAGMLIRLLQRPLFLVATVVEVLGLGLQTVSLGLGALVVVQPLLVLGLLLAVPLSAGLDHRKLERLEVVGAGLTVIGLGAFLTAASPSEGIADVHHLSRALPVAAALLLVTVVCIAASERSPQHRGVLLGLASGALYGVSSGLIKVVAHHFGDVGFRVVLHWPFWAMLVIGGSGLVLTQHAFAAGGLGAPLAVLTLAEPVAAVIVGRFVLEEHLRGGALPILVEVVGAVVAGWGVWLISTQPGAQVRLPVVEAVIETAHPV